MPAGSTFVTGELAVLLLFPAPVKTNGPDPDRLWVGFRLAMGLESLDPESSPE